MFRKTAFIFIKRSEVASSESLFTSFLFFLRWSFTLVTQAGVQWVSLSSLQPLPPVFKQFSCLSLWVAGITGACHYTQLNFCIFSRDGVLPCWPGYMTSISWPHDPLASGSQSAGITGVSHHAQPTVGLLTASVPAQALALRYSVFIHPEMSPWVLE